MRSTNKISKNEKNNQADFDIDEKLSYLLKENIKINYTKLNKFPYNDLLNYTMELEFDNNSLYKQIENYKFEIIKHKQSLIDMQTEIYEKNFQLNSYLNKMKLIDTIKLTEENSSKITNKRNFKTISTHKTNKSNISMEDEKDLSFEENINNSLLETIKKRKKQEINIQENYSKVVEQNKNMIDDLKTLIEEISMLKEENVSLKNIIKEKDNIQQILYQEIDNIRSLSKKGFEPSRVNSTDFNNEKDNFTFNNYNSIIEQNNTILNSKKAFLENLEFIKNSLVVFLNNYQIKENFDFLNYESEYPGSKNSNFSPNKNNEELSQIETLIETRMREIKYILLNLKKINIIFKSLFMEFSKNLLNIFQQNVSEILENKVYSLDEKCENFSQILNKTINKLLKNKYKKIKY